MQPSDSQLTGEPQTIIIDPNTGLPENVIIIGQPSTGPKIIGIFVIIWGALGVINELFNIGNTLSLGGLFIAISVVNVLIAAGFIVGGYMIQDYQQRGVHLSLICIIVSAIVAVSLLAFLPDMIQDIADDENLSDDERDDLEANAGLFAGIGMIIIVVCYGICGLIIAIPMMISNNGLDDSSLFKGWF